MRLPVVAFALLGLMGVGSATADEGRGLYLGAGVGQFGLEIDDLEEVTTDTFDSDDTAFKVFGGWRFNPYIALELDYVDLGAPDDTLEDIRFDVDITAFAPYVIGTLPLGIFEIFAKIGYVFYDVEVSALDQSLDDSDEDLAYGAGVGVVLFEHLNARLEYEIIDISDVEDASAFWLTGAWRF